MSSIKSLKEELDKTKALYKKIEHFSAPAPASGFEDWAINNIIQSKFAFIKLEFVTKCNEILLNCIVDSLTESQIIEIEDSLKKLQEEFEITLDECKKKKLEVKAASKNLILVK